MNVRVRHAKEEAEFEDSRNSARTTGLNCQPDETSDEELAASESRRFPLDIEQLRRIYISNSSVISLEV